ncbi:MAG: hypothetical protein FWG89_02305 [Treponema sp.]|nr:hypothetical protein [Treponema sp.]
MSVQSFSSTLYDCAIECALLRQKRRCKETFGGYACYDCRFNINRYIDADPRHVELFMLQAETQASSIRSAGKLHRIPLALIIAFCLLSAWCGYRAEQQRAERAAARVSQQSPARTARVSQQAPARTVPAANDMQMIESTLRKVTADLRRNVDVNGDGLVNCIDAAVLFYQYYPEKNNVTISLNVNKDTGMNHLFNVVLVNGVWRAIEPQARSTGWTSFWMRDVWKSKYDHRLNKVVTDHYVRYIR